uniref:Uncharacterized protein n=1 Tax=Anguilla anguilla TaxID=7936 RepID=A0A0E9SS62_ANGAN
MTTFFSYEFIHNIAQPLMPYCLITLEMYVNILQNFAQSCLGYIMNGHF